MHALGVVLEAIGLVLLFIEAIEERRASRWKRDMEEADEIGEDVFSQIWGDRLGRGMWRFDRGHWGLALGRRLASLVARFDHWKGQRHLHDLFFLVAIVCGGAGVLISLIFQ